ncbi:MAG TPA: hypothetical protein VG672_02615 [Bryobacteraceae bacterium]|jgi:hypothetical protein|nr:hypothetical protein [Bryobacteraceae bacterium]
MANPALASASVIVAPGHSDLRVKADENVTLSPDSPQFGACYLQIRPHTIEEVRKVIGLSKNGTGSNDAGLPDGVSTPAISPDDLESPDEEVRERAHELAYQASREYLRSADPSSLAPWRPVLDRYLQLSDFVLNVASVADIEVASGATLTFSRNTHAVYARNVRIHEAGRIVCKGPITFKIGCGDEISAMVVSGSAPAGLFPPCDKITGL